MAQETNKLTYGDTNMSNMESTYDRVKLILEKSQVKAHTRTSKSGAVSNVKEYNDKRTKKEPVTHGSSTSSLSLPALPEKEIDLVMNLPVEKYDHLVNAINDRYSEESTSMSDKEKTALLMVKKLRTGKDVPPRYSKIMGGKKNNDITNLFKKRFRIQVDIAHAVNEKIGGKDTDDDIKTLKGKVKKINDNINMKIANYQS